LLCFVIHAGLSLLIDQLLAQIPDKAPSVGTARLLGQLQVCAKSRQKTNGTVDVLCGVMPLLFLKHTHALHTFVY